MFDKNKKNTMLIRLILLILALTTIFAFSMAKIANKSKSMNITDADDDKLFHDTLLVEDFIFTSEWQEIKTENIIKNVKGRYFISINLKKPYEAPLLDDGIQALDGKIINPEIKLIDSEGNEYNLTFTGSRGTSTCHYSYKEGLSELPEGKIYSKLLLRSEYPIQAKSIAWTRYNIKYRK